MEETKMHIAEDRIRDRAYQLWLDAGEPEERDQDFWYQAERELAEEEELDTSREAAALDLPPVVPGRLS
jgi:hypothetical protein